MSPEHYFMIVVDVIIWLWPSKWMWEIAWCRHFRHSLISTLNSIWFRRGGIQQNLYRLDVPPLLHADNIVWCLIFFFFLVWNNCIFGVLYPTKDMSQHFYNFGLEILSVFGVLWHYLVSYLRSGRFSDFFWNLNLSEEGNRSCFLGFCLNFLCVCMAEMSRCCTVGMFYK